MQLREIVATSAEVASTRARLKKIAMLTLWGLLAGLTGLGDKSSVSQQRRLDASVVTFECGKTHAWTADRT